LHSARDPWPPSLSWGGYAGRYAATVEFHMDMNETIRQRLVNAKEFNVGGSPTDSKATLCIYSDELDPEFISRTVKCSPTTARRKGERDPERPKIRPAPIGQWFLEAPDELPFLEKIQFLLNSTTDAENEWRTLAASHHLELRGAIFLRSWSEGFELANDTVADISRRKWSISLSMYSAEGEEILDAFLRTSQDD
jgi:hypothetical protein